MNTYLKKGGIAVADQVLFSGSNFLLNLFLVKLLTPAEYGLFGSLYSVYLLLSIIFIAIFLEPYVYYKNTLGDTNRYTRLYSGFANSLLVLSVLLTIVGCLTHQYLLIYLAYTCSTCVVYFYKRHFLSILSPKSSLIISVNYFVFVSVGLLVLNYIIPKNLFNAFLVLNAASVLSVIPIILVNSQFRTLIYHFKGINDFFSIVERQRKYSFHCFTSGVLSWIPNNVYFIILPIFYSKEVNALFKALQNINLPITHLNIAIVSLLVPIFIKSVNPSKLIKQVSLLFVLMPLLYLLFVLVSLNNIEHYIYDNKYSISPLLVTAMLVGIIPEIIANIYKAFFRSIEKPQIVTKINLLNAFAALAGILTVYYFGLTGVIISYIVVNIFNLLSSIYFFLVEVKNQQESLCRVA